MGWCLSSVVVVLGGSVPSDEFKKPPLPVLAQPPSVSDALNFITSSVMMVHLQEQIQQQHLSYFLYSMFFTALEI